MRPPAASSRAQEQISSRPSRLDAPTPGVHVARSADERRTSCQPRSTSSRRREARRGSAAPLDARVSPPPSPRRRGRARRCAARAARRPARRSRRRGVLPVPAGPPRSVRCHGPFSLSPLRGGGPVPGHRAVEAPTSFSTSLFSDQSPSELRRSPMPVDGERHEAGVEASRRAPRGAPPCPTRRQVRCPPARGAGAPGRAPGRAGACLTAAHAPLAPATWRASPLALGEAGTSASSSGTCCEARRNHRAGRPQGSTNPLRPISSVWRLPLGHGSSAGGEPRPRAVSPAPRPRAFPRDAVGAAGDA